MSLFPKKCSFKMFSENSLGSHVTKIFSMCLMALSQCLFVLYIYLLTKFKLASMLHAYYCNTISSEFSVMILSTLIWYKYPNIMHKCHPHVCSSDKDMKLIYEMFAILTSFLSS